MVVADLVVQGRTPHRRGAKAEPELDALGRLQAEQRARETAVELSVPVDVAAQPHRQAVSHHFDHSSEGIAGLLAGVDLGDHRALRLRIGHPHLRLLGDPAKLGDARFTWNSCVYRPDTHDVAQHLDAKWIEDLPCQRADRDPRGGLARRGPFEYVANVVEIVLEHSGQVGVPGPRSRNRLGLAAILRVDRHPLLPVLEVLVLDDEGDGATQGATEAHARYDSGLVAFDRHAPAAAIAFLAPREVLVDSVRLDLEASRNTLDDCHQFGAVRFAGGKKTQHRVDCPAPGVIAHPPEVDRFNQSWPAVGSTPASSAGSDMIRRGVTKITRFVRVL